MQSRGSLRNGVLVLRIMRHLNSAPSYSIHKDIGLHMVHIIIRMLTPEGHTVVEAAPIVPWSESQDDRPTNGMALCRLCHWYFDEGLMGVGKEYEVLVSKKIKVEQNLPGHILTLRDRHIFTPENTIYWPAHENLDVHRRKKFRV